MLGEIRKSKISDQLKRKYKIDLKGPSVVLEELKQRVTAQAAKLKWYQEKHKQYRQNRMFETNQRRLFEEIKGMTREDGITPDAEESKNLWNGIWGKSVDHNEGAEWLRDMVPHSCIIKCMTIFGVASNVTKLLENSMKGWRMELSSGGVRLGDVNISHGIFQGDSLSPLLFVLSLIPLTLVLRKVKASYDLGDGNEIINHQ